MRTGGRSSITTFSILAARQRYMYKNTLYRKGRETCILLPVNVFNVEGSMVELFCLLLSFENDVDNADDDADVVGVYVVIL